MRLKKIKKHVLPNTGRTAEKYGMTVRKGRGNQKSGWVYYRGTPIRRRKKKASGQMHPISPCRNLQVVYGTDRLSQK